jgi:hypothetical protein
MTMNSIEKLEKQLATKWLKSLGRKDRAEAQRGIAAGRKWGESGRSYNAVKAVVAFTAAAFSEAKVPDGDLWDSGHDAAYDHYQQMMEEAVGDDDADFDDAMDAPWGDPFRVGWFFGVGEAYAGMIETAA